MKPEFGIRILVYTNIVTIFVGKIDCCTRYLRGNIRAQIFTQDTCPSIQRRTGVPLQQKIDFDEHEKHENNEKTRTISG